MPDINRLPGVCDLFKNRFHGASNIRGIQFQVSYYVLRTFELYEPGGPEVLIGEGLEDVDLSGVHVGNEYIQLKYRSGSFRWNELAAAIRSFLPILECDRNVKFTIVTNAPLVGDADILQKHLQHARALPKSIQRSLAALLKGHEGLTVSDLLPRLHFVRISQETIEEKILSEVVVHFSVVVDNAALYVAALFQELLSRSSNRLETRLTDLQELQLRVADQISCGVLNPAVRDRYVFPLEYSDEGGTDDYFEGRAARPAHISAGLDVARPTQDAQIAAALNKAQSCIIVASSGQGKSTLAYRHAIDHYPSGTVYVVRTCQEEADVSQICEYLRQRLCLGLPVLVIIDNLGYGTRLWYEIPSRLAGQQVSFIVTAREEDWFRYAGRTTGATWRIVRPTLSRQEAIAIFRELLARGSVDPGVPSEQWALEMLGEPQLLLEFIYLVTHGELLDERLDGQIRTIRDEPDGGGKLEALRLASVAHRYGVAIPVDLLIEHAGFKTDACLGLEALGGEYINFEGVLCTAFHPVRSERLCRILHGELGTEPTLRKLIGCLGSERLEALVAGAMVDPEVEPRRILDGLARRCIGEQPGFAARMAHICQDAEQARYFHRHRQLFDEAYRQGGDGLVELLAMQTVPNGEIGIIDFLRTNEPGEQPHRRLFEQLLPQFSPRVTEDRVDRLFLRSYLGEVEPSVLAANLPALAELAQVCFHAGARLESVKQAFLTSNWEECVFEMDVFQAADLALSVYRVAPDLYEQWRRERWTVIVSFYEWKTRTLSVREESGGIVLQFPVEWQSDGRTPHEQTMERLNTLRDLLPNYDNYGSDGLYLLGEDRVVGHDETHQRIPADSLPHQVDIRANQAWMRACVDHYAADSLTIWAQRWAGLRSACHRFVKLISSCYIRTLQGRDAHRITGQIVKLWSTEILPGLERVRFAPPGIPNAQRRKLEEPANAWNQSFQNFGRQFLTHPLADPEGHNARLMRVNLRNTIRALDEFDEALRSVASVVGSHSDVELRAERDDYVQALDLIDYWFETGGNYTENPKSDVAAWKRRITEGANERLRRAERSLQLAGIEVLFSRQFFDMGEIRGLCLAFEVRDFRQIAQDVMLLVDAVQQSEVRWDALYALPLVGGRRYTDRALRVSRLNVELLLAGDELIGPLITPIVPEGCVAVVVEGISLYIPPEVALVAKFSDLVEGSTRELRLLQAATSRLDPLSPYQARLLAEYEQQNSARTAELTAELDGVMSSFRALSPRPDAMIEWVMVLRSCDSVAQKVRDGSLDRGDWPAPLESVPSQMETYLNRAYLQIP